MLLSKIPAAIYGLCSIRQELDMYHFNLGSHQPCKVGLLLPLQKRKTRARKVRCQGWEEVFLKSQPAFSRPLSRSTQGAEFVCRCSHHPQVSPNACFSCSVPKACVTNCPHTPPVQKRSLCTPDSFSRGTASGASGGTVTKPLVVPNTHSLLP